MKLVARTFLLLLLAVPVLAIAAIWLCFQNAPSVTRSVQLTPQDIENAKRIIDQHDPGKTRPDRPRTIAISEQDLDLMLNYAASRFGRGAARASLQPGTVRLQASAEIPQSPFGRYLNVDAALSEVGALPRFDYLRVGRLSVPDALADFMLRKGLAWIAASDRGEVAADIVKGVTVSEGRLMVTYVWSKEIEQRLRAVLLSPDDQARLRVYHDRLVQTVAKAPTKVSLAALMPPVFQAVVERGSSDVAAENRAAIVVLAFYANGAGLAAIAPVAAQWPQPSRRTVTLAARDDFPKHFLVSAAIAAAAGSPLADAIGLYKEVDDSRGGSGFSFNDIAADRAGTRFGEIASRAPEQARKLARAVASGVEESDFMPDVADLPEFMPEADFKRRYGGIGGAGYQKMMTTIEARVASRPLLR